MSLLNIIKQELERGKVMLPSGVEIPFVVAGIGGDVRIVGWENFYILGCSTIQRCTFHVAPQDPFYGKDELLRRFFQGRGTVQFVNGLNLLLDNLLPNLQPNKKTPFELAYEKYLYYGNLEFKEQIGKRIVREESLVMTDDDFQNNHGFSSGQMDFPQEEKEIFRDIYVRVYPHYDIARFVAKQHGHARERTKEIRYIRLNEYMDECDKAEIEYLKEFLSEKVKSK